MYYRKNIILKGDNCIYMRWSYRQTSSISLISFIVITASIILSPILIISLGTKPAFGDGLTQEQMSASLGNRKADLLIKMIPPVVTTETLQKGQKPTVEFRLFDSNTNQSFSHVTYYIVVEDKIGKRLLADMFHDHNGDLKMEINPSNTSKISISGDQEPLLGTWLGTSANPIIVSGPLFLSGGLYHFIVRIETIDFDVGVLPADQEPIYDSWLSIGNTENKQISIDGKQIPIKVISYYDKLKDFTFDNKNMQMKFDMPFNWNLTRLNKASIFVHEEVNVPKPNAFSANGSSSSSPPSYIGKVNGIDVSKSVMVDNTQPDKNVIHVMLPKNTILQLANQVNKNGQQQQQASNQGLMEFSLQPNTGPASSGSMGSMGSMSMGSMSSGSMGSMSLSSSGGGGNSHAGNNTNSSATTATVSIVKGSSSPSITKPYDPSPLTIKTGTSVTWTNNDSTLHTVSSGLPEQGAVGTLFDSSLIAPGKTYKHTFDKTGTFDYSCTLHPFMHGQVIVK